MADKQDYKEKWLTKSDVFEALHYLAIREGEGVGPTKLKDLTGKGSVQNNSRMLNALLEENVTTKKNNKHHINFKVFSQVTEKLTETNLKDKQAEVVNKYSKYYLKDRETGTVKKMLVDDLVEGILSLDQPNQELIDLVEKIQEERSDYETPGDYVSLALDE